MKEIKFRAWDKQYDKMVMVDLLLFITHELDYQGNNNEPKSWEHFEVMQYTGLKDKNGKEIYEGDIVRYKDPYNKILFFIEWDSLRAKYGIGQITKTTSDAHCFRPNWHTYTEVIGNIYENPELLTKGGK